MQKGLDVAQFRQWRGAAEGSSLLCIAQQFFGVSSPGAAEGGLGFREGIPSVERHPVNKAPASGPGAEVGVRPLVLLSKVTQWRPCDAGRRAVKHVSLNSH